MVSSPFRTALSKAFAAPVRTAREAARTVTLQPGQEIARYRLIDEIGRGGMGVVWRARDTRLDRDVALKTLAPHLVGDASRRERFIREAKAAAAVSHPNLAAIYDVGEAGGVVYLAMELVEGRTLRELAREGPVPLAKILSVGAQIAEGLGRAHREGIVHRDIKPDNVIVDETGHAKILDFGLAKLRGAQEEERAADRSEQETLEALTKEGQTVGTVPYMSPEQARGKPTDGRSDLFSLGTVLYELATGRLPFRGETSMDTMTAILTEEPAPPSSLNPKIGERLAELLDKCLQKDPGRRYQSAADLAIDLRRLAEGPASSFHQAAGARPTTRSNLLRVAAAAAVLVAVIATAPLWLNRRAGPPGKTVEGTSAGATVKPPEAISSLAVIPLDDHSPGEEERYFADGMTEALITELAQLSDLKVISRTSVMQYRDERPPLPVIAEELGVDAVVEGSILRAGGRIRITAQLLDAREDRHLWAGSYERDHADVLTLQREVAAAVAGEIQGALRPGGRAVRAEVRPIIPEAHDLLLRGQQNVTFGTEESLRRSILQFQTALEIDPGYAEAWVGIANAWRNLANEHLAPREAMPHAKEAALRALALDPGLAEAHTALAFIQLTFEWNFEEAERSLRHALEINPNSAEANLFYGTLEVARGRRDRGIELALKGLKLDPLSANVAFWASFVLFMGRDYERSLEIAEDHARRFPSRRRAHTARAWSLEFLGREEESLAAAERAVELGGGGIWTLAFLARAQAVAGRGEAARETLARLEGASQDHYQCPYETAMGYVILEEYDHARDLFEQGIEVRSDCWTFGGHDPRIDTIRELPWFKDLLARRTPMGPDDPDYVEIPEGLTLGGGS